MEWLNVSRFNSQPSLVQTQGYVFDPLTPFGKETNNSSGVKDGNIISWGKFLNLIENGIRFNSPPYPGKLIKTIEDLKIDVRPIGENLVTIYKHVPGMSYRWKSGVFAKTYNNQSGGIADRSKTDPNEFKRDVGLFVTNTSFDNIDSANIISILIMGVPYNLAFLLPDRRII
jgi:hypothetical protein